MHGNLIKCSKDYILPRTKPACQEKSEVFRGALMRSHAGLGALPVRCKDIFPLNLVLRQKSISRLGFSPATTGLRDARHRIGGHLLGQQCRAFVQALVAQVNVLEFFCCPTHATLPQLNTKSVCYAPFLKLCVMRWVDPTNIAWQFDQMSQMIHFTRN